MQRITLYPLTDRAPERGRITGRDVRLARTSGSPASGARHRRELARQARNVVGRPHIYQAANGVWLTDRVQPGYLSGSWLG
jgi:hypothetical protein